MNIHGREQGRCARPPSRRDLLTGAALAAAGAALGTAAAAPAVSTPPATNEILEAIAGLPDHDLRILLAVVQAMRGSSRRGA